jgi:ureidoglycolate lyase
MTEMRIAIEEANQEKVKPYGNLIDTEKAVPNAHGAVFDYWDGLGEMEIEGKISFGMVQSHPGPLVATNLERHLKTSEGLIPITGDIVLVVGAATSNGHADLSTVKAFRIPQGKAILLHPGTWHYVPLNQAQEVKTMVVFRFGTAQNDLHVDDFSKERNVTIQIFD